MSVVKQLDQKRFIGYSNDSKKHQHHHISNGNQSVGDQRWQIEQGNTKKKQNGQAHLVQSQYGSNTIINNHQQINNQFVGEFIPQKATEQAKKEKRNKDRLSHLSKLLPQKARWIGYLDVGCGNAEISVTIAQHLGIGSVYGVDMFDEDDFIQPSMDLEVKYIQNLNNKIKIPSNSVDLISCFMAIHHFEHLDLMLREIQRVLLIDGYLFIREHDVPSKNKQLRTYIEEQHRKYPDHPADGYMMLYDREELKDILFAYGFEHLGDSNYTGQNLQAVYHSLYILKRKEINANAKQLIHKNKREELSESFDEEGEQNSSNQSRESISSQEGINLNQLSLNSDKKQSSQVYNRKEMFESYYQNALQQQSDSVISSEPEKDPSPVVEKKLIPSNQKSIIIEAKSTKKQPTNPIEKIPNLLNGWDDYTTDFPSQNRYQSEEEDVYANIVSVPPQKKESNNQQQKQQQQLQLKKPVKPIEKAQLLNTFNQQYSPQRSEKQKNQIFDDDGFVVVGQKDNKLAKKQPQQKANTNASQITQSITNQKKQELLAATTTITSASYNNKKDSIDIEENTQCPQQNNRMKEEVGGGNEEEDDENSFSIKDTSNQFIYIKSKKQKKNKNKK